MSCRLGSVEVGGKLSIAKPGSILGCNFFFFFLGRTDLILSVFEMALTDYANKIFKLIESHQKSAGLAKLYLKNVKEWLG